MQNVVGFAVNITFHRVIVFFMSTFKLYDMYKLRSCHRISFLKKTKIVNIYFKMYFFMFFFFHSCGWIYNWNTYCYRFRTASVLKHANLILCAMNLIDILTKTDWDCYNTSKLHRNVNEQWNSSNSKIRMRRVRSNYWGYVCRRATSRSTATMMYLHSTAERLDPDPRIRQSHLSRNTFFFIAFTF